MSGELALILLMAMVALTSIGVYLLATYESRRERIYREAKQPESEREALFAEIGYRLSALATKHFTKID